MDKDKDNNKDNDQDNNIESLIICTTNTPKILHLYKSQEVQNYYGLQMWYTKYKSLGSGSFGEVYLIISNIINKMLALKMTYVHNNVNKREIQNFHIIRKIDECHKYIPDIYHIFQKDDYNHIVMDFIVGQHLSYEYFVSIKSIKSFIYLFKNICVMISCFHKYKFIINDLKPDNMIINYKMEPYLIDLGMIAHFDVLVDIKIGTPVYIPPEIMNDDIQSNDKKDIWALGVMMYETITNKCQFENIIIEQNKRYHMLCNYLDPVLDEVQNELHESLYLKFGIECDKDISMIINIIMSCLCVDHTKRTSIVDILTSPLFVNNT